MGFLSSLFGGKGVESLEDRLAREYTEAFRAMGASPSEARQSAKSLIDNAKKLVQERGWNNESPGRGDKLFEAMESNSKVREVIETLRKEGVRDDDIRKWNNLPALERAAILTMDDLGCGAGWLGLVRQGLDPADATMRMWKAHVKFGSPSSESGEDRPLPIELKFRIVAYIERQMLDPISYKAKNEEFSSFNALLRYEMHQGNF